MNYNVGDKITVKTKLKRIDSTVSRWYKEKKWNEIPFREPLEAYVVGVRTLSNGTADYDTDCGWMYTGKDYFKALMVTKGINSKPFFIPFEPNF